MSRSDVDAQILEGATVVFTGRLACMTHEEAADLVRACGGETARKPSRNCAMLVIGGDASLIERDGRITRNLERARELAKEGSPIRIVTEKEFLRHLGLEDREEGVHRYYTMAQLSRILGVPRDRIRMWMNRGLIRPAREVRRLCYFDFQQVRDAKTLWDLSQAGVSLDRIRASLDRLRRWMPDLDRPIANLDLLERDGKLLVRLGDGELVEPSGQLVFDLEGGGSSPAEEPIDAPRTLEQWLDLALHQEQAGEFEKAEEAYRAALMVAGPQPVLCFNLANVLYAIGHKERAVERFYQAVEMDQDYVEAWNNLGNVLGDLGAHPEAIEAYDRAIELAPDYPDPHFNVAETHAALGDVGAARQHWLVYLKLDPESPWAERIREALRQNAGDAPGRPAPDA